MKQIEIATFLDADQSIISRILSKKLKVSWNIAQKMQALFPEQNITYWKNASSDQFIEPFMSLSFNEIQKRKEHL